MEILSELIGRVENGESFNVDFEKRNLKVGKEYLVKDGEYDKSNLECLQESTDDVLHTIERLYEEYKYSLPSERSDNKRRKYFKALTIEEIPDEKLFGAERREVTKAKLEGYILCSILNRNLVWNDSWGKWFWQSTQDQDLVLLRSWIENKNI